MLLPLLLGLVLFGQQEQTPAATPQDAAPSAVTQPDEQPALERPSAANVPATAAGPDRWLLMKALQGTWPGAMLDESRTAVYGWVDVGLTVGSAGSNNLPLGFNYRDNNVSLQQDWLRIERTVVATGTSEPTFGFRVDAIFGTDYRFTAARGIFDHQLTSDNGQPQIYGFDPVQFYVEAYFPTVAAGMDVKVGRFFAQYGVESIDAPSNALFSHAYAFIDNPFTHTGVLTTTQWTPAWSSQAGLVLGEDIFISPADQPAFIGDVKWAAPGGRDSVTLSTILGSARYDQRHNQNNLDLIDLVITHKLNSRLTYTFECLGGYQTNLPQIGTTTWLAVVNYFTLDISSHLGGTTRLELWDDPRGQRTSYPGLYTAITAGLNYHPCKAVIFRPELRYDANDESRPFQGQHGLFTAAADLILRW